MTSKKQSLLPKQRWPYLKIMEVTTWNVLQKLQNPEEIESEFAIIILNQSILCEPEVIKSLWRTAALRILVDGGSNKWLDFLETSKTNDLKLPDFISGDFDSIKPRTREYFASRKVEMIYTPDQDETDFTKALRCAANFIKIRNLNVKLVIAVCENCGRFDQALANLNTLHRSRQILHNAAVIILSSQSVTWVLPPGKQSIFVTEEFVEQKYSCGLIPFCGPTLVTTSGLKWNLEDTKIEMGGLISTSNTYVANEISVTCDRHIVWTTQYCKIDQEL